MGKSGGPAHFIHMLRPHLVLLQYYSFSLLIHSFAGCLLRAIFSAAFHIRSIFFIWWFCMLLARLGFATGLSGLLLYSFVVIVCAALFNYGFEQPILARRPRYKQKASDITDLKDGTNMKRFIISVVVVVVALIALAFLTNGADVVQFVYRVF